MTTPTTDLFDEVVKFPNGQALDRYADLVGLDDVKKRVMDYLHLVADPACIDNWAKKHHRNGVAFARGLMVLPRLVIFGGDVGTGKTALGETLGAAVAKKEKIPVTLFRLSLRVRGTGIVGEMTKLLGDAFAEVRGLSADRKRGQGRASGLALLLIDEADALAQSRSALHMHHEDRAGVNALIRGIDDITTRQLPVAVILCTNRVGALDPAVCRRAIETFVFRRPDLAQCLQVLKTALNGAEFSGAQIHEIAEAMGARDGRDYGYTYSDILQRYVPQLVLGAASADVPLTFAGARDFAMSMQPTPPFGGSGS
jgi:AAA+ superfamily predicted ATPase